MPKCVLHMKLLEGVGYGREIVLIQTLKLPFTPTQGLFFSFAADDAISIQVDHVQWSHYAKQFDVALCPMVLDVANELRDSIGKSLWSWEIFVGHYESLGFQPVLRATPAVFKPIARKE